MYINIPSSGRGGGGFGRDVIARVLTGEGDVHEEAGEWAGGREMFTGRLGNRREGNISL